MSDPKQAVKKVSALEVFLRMQENDDKALKLAPLSNIIEARKVKGGTKVTIGFGADVIAGILNGDFVGGLIVCDKVAFERVKAELAKGDGTTPRS